MWFRASATGTKSHPSLRRRLLVVVLATIALASLAQGVVAYLGALRTADAIFDRYLQNLAQAIQGGEMPGGVDLFEFSIRAWGPGGVEVYRGLARVPDQPVIGFSDAKVDGVRFRVYQLRTAGRTIQVAQDLDARQARARRLALDAVMPTALLAPLLMLAVWLLIERAVAPVERVRRQVADRRAEDLSPLAEEGLPQEIAPLVHELNQLLGRARQSLETQQRFIADAAHELRSPLAALKLQAQAVSRAEGTTRDAAIIRLNEGIERAIALASQLLALARAEAATIARREPVDLEALWRDCVADLLPLAHAREVDVGLSHSEPTSVQGDLESLRMLVRNLLDNAVKYSPDGGKVDISIRSEAGAALLCVEDSGPGIAPEQRQLALEPFARLPGQERVPGSGLGLAIVSAVVRSYGGQLELGRSERLGGLRACVRLPEAVLSDA